MTLVSTQVQISQVCKYRIDLPKSYKLMEMAVERYNAQFPKPVIKLPHVFLMRELIRLYASEFRRWQAARGFAVELDWEQMPLLSTNNQFLGDITGRTGRSIRNYRKALEKAGFLAALGFDEEGDPVYSIHHGRTSDFELAISPEFLWIEGRNSTARLRPRNAPTSCSRKNFPPTSTSTGTCTQQEQHELVGGKKSSDAENFSASNQPEQPEQPVLASGMPPEQQAQQEPENRNECSSQLPGQARTEGRPAAADEARLDWETWAQKGAKVLWKLAQTWLYPGEVFPQGRRQAILARLVAMYGDPPHPSIPLYEKITDVYQERLKLTQLYWHREHGALPEPEAFFDTGNTENGFVLTKKWVDDEKKYPPPPRATYRKPGQQSRGGIQRGKTRTIADILR